MTAQRREGPGRVRAVRLDRAGKLAELAVIDGNPVARPAEIRNVTLVFKDGLGYDAPKLIESTKGIVGIR